MVFAMVVIGSITRLSGSGLSIAEWAPLSGALPPLTQAEWDRVFALYRATPQYRAVNFGMTLAEFETIFWWEWLHRFWGRLIGLVFVLPLLAFAVAGRIRRAEAGGYALLFALGGAQGVLGWYMVASGLVDEPRVSQYRLAAHLALALVLYVALLLAALRRLAPPADAVADDRLDRVRRLLVATLAVAATTVLSGAFMAGTHAGLTYNTFPLMDGALLPDGLYAAPWWRAPFESIETIQFNHLLLAVLTLALVLATWWQSRWLALAPRARVVVNGTALAVAAQVALGIATLLLAVPLPLGVLHQAGAVVLLSLLVWLWHELLGGLR
ncbi:MAG: heme A synthase [Alphaproteobacteria bacterium]|nr:heme A synthase [Alphaproteobacteria bacterium]